MKRNLNVEFAERSTTVDNGDDLVFICDNCQEKIQTWIALEMILMQVEFP